MSTDVGSTLDVAQAPARTRVIGRRRRITL
jgi:hypothetical protein